MFVYNFNNLKLSASMNRLAIVLVLLALFAAIMWALPNGTGEYRDSPNKAFTANASNMSRGTLQGKVDYIELLITEKSSTNTFWKPNTIWHLQRNLRAGEAVSDFGDRSKSFIVWSADSKNVTFSLRDNEKIVVPIQ
jgi:hypothetical protein